MGIKDQFQDKANQLKEQAQKAREGTDREKASKAADETRQRAQRQGWQSTDDIRDEFDDRS
ncbi:hypothetical protein ACM614_16540 [Streptomyces sp. 12297]